MSPLTEMDFNNDGVCRVARTLLSHVRPQSRSDAFTLIDGCLGVYALDRTVIAAEIEYYFGGDESIAA